MKKKNSKRMKTSLEQRADLYRESSCIEEYYINRDLQMPSFRWKIFDSVVFCSKHQALIQAVFDGDNAFPAFPFVVIGFCVGGILTALCSCFFDCCLSLVFFISTTVSSFLGLMFFLKMCNVCFELRILRIRKK